MMQQNDSIHSKMKPRTWIDCLGRDRRLEEARHLPPYDMSVDPQVCVTVGCHLKREVSVEMVKANDAAEIAVSIHRACDLAGRCDPLRIRRCRKALHTSAKDGQHREHPVPYLRNAKHDELSLLAGCNGAHDTTGA